MAYALALRAEWERLPRAAPWNDSSEALAREWQGQGVALQVAVAAMRLGAARGNGKINGLRYFEPILRDAEGILQTAPGYFDYVNLKLDAQRAETQATRQDAPARRNAGEAIAARGVTGK